MDCLKIEASSFRGYPTGEDPIGTIDVYKVISGSPCSGTLEKVTLYYDTEEENDGAEGYLLYNDEFLTTLANGVFFFIDSPSNRTHSSYLTIVNGMLNSDLYDDDEYCPGDRNITPNYLSPPTDISIYGNNILAVHTEHNVVVKYEYGYNSGKVVAGIYNKSQTTTHPTHRNYLNVPLLVRWRNDGQRFVVFSGGSFPSLKTYTPNGTLIRCTSDDTTLKDFQFNTLKLYPEDTYLQYTTPVTMNGIGSKLSAFEFLGSDNLPLEKEDWELLKIEYDVLPNMGSYTNREVIFLGMYRKTTDVSKYIPIFNTRNAKNTFEYNIYAIYTPLGNSNTSSALNTVELVASIKSEITYTTKSTRDGYKLSRAADIIPDFCIVESKSNSNGSVDYSLHTIFPRNIRHNSNNNNRASEVWVTNFNLGTKITNVNTFAKDGGEQEFPIRHMAFIELYEAAMAKDVMAKIHSNRNGFVRVALSNADYRNARPMTTIREILKKSIKEVVPVISGVGAGAVVYYSYLFHNMTLKIIDAVNSGRGWRYNNRRDSIMRTPFGLRGFGSNNSYTNNIAYYRGLDAYRGELGFRMAGHNAKVSLINQISAQAINSILSTLVSAAIVLLFDGSLKEGFKRLINREFDNPFNPDGAVRILKSSIYQYYTGDTKATGEPITNYIDRMFQISYFMVGAPMEHQMEELINLDSPLLYLDSFILPYSITNDLNNFNVLVSAINDTDGSVMLRRHERQYYSFQNQDYMKNYSYKNSGRDSILGSAGNFTRITGSKLIGRTLIND